MAQINKPSEYFNTVLYTGTGSGGSNRQITGVGFQPDFTWVKTRGSSQEHVLSDSVRGATKALDSQATTAEETTSTRIGAFISDGFQLGSGALQNRVNENGVGLVAWNWKANGAGVSNTAGSITSTVSANTTSGFSIVKWSGTSATGTIGHGLGVAPKVVIVKSLANAEGWYSYWQPLGNDKQVQLNATSALGTTTLWNSTTPTSSVFSVINHSAVNGSGDYIAYCFADVKGFAKMGSYTGNGNADGTFIYTGFKPAFVLVKQSHAVRYWAMFDNKRDGFNPTNRPLFPNAADQESDSVNYYHDILSNGFKWRTNSNIMNENGGSYIYMAFAENPLVGTNDIPTTAR
jgi:hypothetical protein